MALLRVEIDFQLDAEVWLNRDCLGQSIRLNRDHVEMEIRLPPFVEHDSTAMELSQLNFEGYAGAASGRTGEPRRLRIAINRFRVIIREDVDGISQADVAGGREIELSELISRHQQHCKRVAERLAIDFLDRLRMRGQIWLGTIGSISYSVSPQATTYEEQTNYRFLLGHGGTFIVPARPEAADLDRGLFDGLKESLADSASLPLPESFIADAEHFLELGTQTDLQRAVLLAAVGCELKVKETLQKKVFQRGLPLVKALIENPRDFSMSAAGLFDKALKAATGYSLKDHDRKLYNGIDGERGLFYRRNKIAHTGLTVEPAAAKESLQYARTVFAWLDDLPFPEP